MPEDKQIFLRHIEDICALSEKRGCAVFSNFLSESEQVIAERIARDKKVNYSFSGGYENAERKIFAAGEPYAFPYETLTCRFRKTDTLTHRDFLGALMALGFKRELIGDILVGEGYALIFCSDTIISMIADELNKVGRVGIKVENGLNAPIPEQEYEVTDYTVASLRLDCIVAAVTRLSREKAVRLISGGKVQVNGIEAAENDREVPLSSKLSVRGYGKFLLESSGELTRKGKTHIQIKKYL